MLGDSPMKCAQRDCNQPAQARSNYCADHAVKLVMQERYTATFSAQDHDLRSMPPMSGVIPSMADGMPSYSRGSGTGRIVFWVVVGVIAIAALVPGVRHAVLHLLRIAP